MNSEAGLQALPPNLRRKRLFQLHNSQDFAAIADLGQTHIAKGPMQEALIVANAFYRLDDCDRALELLRRRQIEEDFAERHINLMLGMARRSHNWPALIAASKMALRRDPLRAELLGYMATGLRRLRRMGEVERLGTHLVWRYRTGRLPLANLIDMLRAMRTRRPVLALERNVARGPRREAKIGFVEALIELAELDRAQARMATWGITAAELSQRNRGLMAYFDRRKRDLGAKTQDELATAVLDRVDRLPGICVPARPAGAARRILVTTSSLGIGGAERQLSYLTACLAGLTEAVELVVYCQTKQGPNVVSYDIPCRVVYKAESEGDRAPFDFVDEPKDSIEEDIAFAFGLDVRDIAELIARFRPDVVYSAVGLPTEALIAARLAKLDNVVVRFGGDSFYNSFDHSDENDIRIRIAEFCCRASSPGVRFVTNSHNAKAAWAQRLKIAPTRFRVIANGVKLPLAGPATNGRETGLTAHFPDTAFVVGWVGRFHQVKRPAFWFDIAFELALRHVGARFLIVGEGPLRARMEAKVRRRGLAGRFVFTGLVAGDLSVHYRSMDVLLQASDTESFPNVILEALSHGVPVVARAVGDVPLILCDPRLGAVVGEDVAKAYVAAVEEVLDRGGDDAGERAYRARHVAEHYGIAAMCGAYGEVLGIEVADSRS